MSKKMRRLSRDKVVKALSERSGEKIPLNSVVWAKYSPSGGSRETFGTVAFGLGREGKRRKALVRVSVSEPNEAERILKELIGGRCSGLYRSILSAGRGRVRRLRGGKSFRGDGYVDIGRIGAVTEVVVGKRASTLLVSQEEEVSRLLHNRYVFGIVHPDYEMFEKTEKKLRRLGLGGGDVRKKEAGRVGLGGSGNSGRAREIHEWFLKLVDFKGDDKV